MDGNEAEVERINNVLGGRLIVQQQGDSWEALLLDPPMEREGLGAGGTREAVQGSTRLEAARAALRKWHSPA